MNAKVLDAYGYTCAATRRRFAPEDAGAANLAVVPIHPTEIGGSYAPNNLIPFCLDVAMAFQDGDFTVGIGLELVVDLARIDPEVLRRLHSDGKLLLPTQRDCWPDVDNLRYHRERIFLAVGG